jgi:hypothetical protein
MTTTNSQLSAAIAEAVDGQLTDKKWYLSKTFWANTVSGLIVIAQIKYGFVAPVEYQMLALSFINMGLRKITNTPVIW